MMLQSVKNQRAEVNFRRKMMEQQTNYQDRKDSADSSSLEKLLRSRMHKTRKRMLSLKAEQIALSPYIELGAERCQRSLVMENDLGAHGASVDISFDSLKSCEGYNKKVAKSNLPVRICCDANNLPFKSNSIPFVFCYQTLHHFPDVCAVIQQIHRVLAPNGCFFFDEEPYKNVLHLNLYEKSLFEKKPLLRLNRIQNILDLLLAKREFDAGEEAGILENYGTSINEWKTALNIFQKTDLSFEGCLTKKNVLALREIQYLTGGIISGLCRKKSIGKVFKPQPLMENLICPACLQQHDIEVKLTKKNNSLSCDRCGDKYPIADGVMFLFTKSKLRELYPEIAELMEENNLEDGFIKEFFLNQCLVLPCALGH
jgi:SAM-dependent methyltransferase/uncharacterized protein YbaR (Trm112 family)